MDDSISQVLRQRLAAGDPAALSEATALLYRELRAAARAEMRGERKDHTLQPTGLVHEALIRMRGSAQLAVDGSNHFLNLAREVMRHVLQDHARARNTAKRRYLRAQQPLEALQIAGPVALAPEWDNAMGLVDQHDPQRGRVLRMKYLLGHTWDEIAAVLGISVNQARYIESQAIEWLRRRYTLSR